MDLCIALAAADEVGKSAAPWVGLIVVLGIVVVGVMCVVNAYKFRTTSWIVAGILGGLVVTVIASVFTVGLMRGVQKAIDGAEFSGSEDDGSSSISSRSPATELVLGHDMAYSIRVPVAWTTKTEVDAFDTLSSRKSLYVGVIAEEGDLGTPETITELARKQVADVATDIRWDEPEPLMLDGRSWLQFTVDCKMNKIPITYQFYVYSGPEGTYQIVGWTIQNLYERDAPQMHDVMQTFRFPEETAR